jgi:hypothetical protein
VPRQKLTDSRHLPLYACTLTEAIAPDARPIADESTPKRSPPQLLDHRA